MLEDDKHSLGNQISWVLCQVVKLTARLTSYVLPPQPFLDCLLQEDQQE